ncbi:MAG: hypothetical protein IJT82_03595 [Schwartzia sp.]|nr:hypothetical protein [Schwartzia sp. (in: firmicutes)]
MNLRGLLHGIMYKDTASVYRLAPVMADDGSDDWQESEEAIYSDIPCKLSQYGKELSVDKKERAVDVSINLRLCCDPDYDIRENDRVMVNHRGKIFDLYAGVRFPYPTHQEISMRRKMEAGNDGASY